MDRPSLSVRSFDRPRCPKIARPTRFYNSNLQEIWRGHHQSLYQYDFLCGVMAFSYPPDRSSPFSLEGICLGSMDSSATYDGSLRQYSISISSTPIRRVRITKSSTSPERTQPSVSTAASCFSIAIKYEETYAWQTAATCMAKHRSYVLSKRTTLC